VIIHVIHAASSTYPMLLFGHIELYIWSSYVYECIDRYGLYHAFEKAGISPA
jgi:hypothetical protein